MAVLDRLHCTVGSLFGCGEHLGWFYVRKYGTYGPVIIGERWLYYRGRQQCFSATYVGDCLGPGRQAVFLER